MRWLRDWCAWASAWVLVVQTPMWLAIAAESWQERTDPTLEPMYVPSWVPTVAYVAAVLVPVALVLVVLGTRVSRVARVGHLVGAVALAVAAVSFSGFPSSTVGPFYVGLTALAAACALVAALVPARDLHGEPPMRLAGLALVGAGAYLAWTCWHGGGYWDWRTESALVYELGLGLSVALVVLGLTATRWGQLHSRVLRWGLLLVGAVGALYFAVGALSLQDLAVLYRWEEDESAWDIGTPILLLGLGPFAAGVAAWRRRGDLVAWSLASGITFSMLSLWQESTWGSVMG